MTLASAVAGTVTTGGAVYAANHGRVGGLPLAVGAVCLVALAIWQRRRSLSPLVVAAVLTVVLIMLTVTAATSHQPAVALRVVIAAIAGSTIWIVVDAAIDPFLVGLAATLVGWFGWIAVACVLVPAAIAGIQIRDRARAADRDIDRRAGGANLVLAAASVITIVTVPLLFT
jgi:hypothetical protein